MCCTSSSPFTETAIRGAPSSTGNSSGPGTSCARSRRCRQSCIDTRSLVAWLREQGYVEVGVTGFSMGASIAMVLACLDPTPDYVIPIVGHLQISDAIENAPIFWRMKADLERFGIDSEGRKDIFDGLGLERLLPRLRPESQLWIMAKDDGYVTAPRVEEQWRAWGRPPNRMDPGRAHDVRVLAAADHRAGCRHFTPGWARAQRPPFRLFSRRSRSGARPGACPRRARALRPRRPPSR